MIKSVGRKKVRLYFRSPGGGGGWRSWCAPVAMDSGAEVRCAVHGAPEHRGAVCSARCATAGGSTAHCTVLRVVTDGEKAHDGKFDRIESVDT